MKCCENCNCKYEDDISYCLKCYLPLSLICEPQKREENSIYKNKKKMVVIITIISIAIIIISFNIIKTEYYKKDIIKQAIKIAEEYKLTDIKGVVSYYNKTSYSKVYNLNIYSELFFDLSMQDKYEFINKIDNIRFPINSNKILMEYIYSNNFKYDIYEFAIRKNGDIIYTDYNSKREAENKIKESEDLQKRIQEQINNSHQNSTDISDGDKGFAWAVAEREVKGSLKAPSTAKFPSYSHATITKRGNNFTVLGYVDAENSFGAKLRTNFTVEFEKTGSDTYKVIRVNLDE